MLFNKIRKLQKICLNENYICSGEIYKLLNKEFMKELIKKINKDSVDFVTLVNNKKRNLTYQENFLLILDKYIGYVRDNYNIKHYELIFVLEETLKNKYNRCLFFNINIYSDYKYFIAEFRKMFLYNIFNNTKLFYKISNGKLVGIKRAYKYLKNKSLDNLTDLNYIENFFIEIINNRRDNIFYCFKDSTSIKKDNFNFYINALEWLYEDYYE